MICSQCKKDKDDFYTYSSGRVYAKCKECLRANQAEARKKSKEAMATMDDDDIVTLQPLDKNLREALRAGFANMRCG